MEHSVWPKIAELSKRGLTMQNFPRKVSGKFENFWISEMRIIQLKIPEIPGAKSNEKEILDKKFSKIWVYLMRLSLLRKIQVHSPLEISVFGRTESLLW